MGASPKIFDPYSTGANSGLFSGEMEKALCELVGIGASDIIISEFHKVMILRHGCVEPVEKYSSDIGRSIFFAVMERLQVEPTALKGGAIESSLTIGEHRFRVSAFSEHMGGRIVMRVLSNDIPSPDQLNIPDIICNAAMQLQQGLILICGPTGSGKSTAIASLLTARGKSRAEHVISLEDPVEYLLPNDLTTVYSQREIGRDEPSFAQGLRSSLRQSPHVIVIGEIRDGDTAATALEASETGHLVVATIHATSADMTAQRYAKMIPPERQEVALDQLANNVELIICQRLCRASSGYRGRVAIHEVMVKTSATTNCIRKCQWSELRQEMHYGGRKGHITFERSIQMLFENQKITEDEANAMLQTVQFQSQQPS